ncbi:MAG: hypothetical protein KC910_04485 [Candidatus Eremiobacteraeota bacterium]|nr:hypothetical protein [Candidatus Eremiobacteraeota bacterium]
MHTTLICHRLDLWNGLRRLPDSLRLLCLLLMLDFTERDAASYLGLSRGALRRAKDHVRRRLEGGEIYARS